MNCRFLQTISCILLFFFYTANLFGQGAICMEMEGFCTDSGAAFPASVNTVAEPGNTYGCLSTQPNPAWYYFEIAVGGDLIVELTNSANVDVDFIVYGPFADLAAAQANCGSLVAGTDPFGCNLFSGTCPNGVPCDVINSCPTGQAVDCSYDPQAVEVVDILNTQVGEVYVLLITNFSNLPTDIFANQIGGTAATDCSVVTVCPTVGFYDITANSPIDCNASPIALQAFDAVDAGGFITPGFDFAIETDGSSTLENTLEFFDGPNGTGNSLGIFPLGAVPSNTNWSIFGEYYEAGIVYSAVWCDTGNDGSFNYSVTDHASGTVLISGTALGSNGCTTINFGPLTGMGSFSGPGVTDQGNGVGFFTPSAAGDGIHTIIYSWDDGQGCSGTASQLIEVTGCLVCTADAGTFTTPNGLVICFGEDFVMTSNNDYDGSFETGDNMDVPLPDGGLGGPLDGIDDADGDGVNGIVYALYTAPPGAYILTDPNFFTTFGSEPTGLFGNGSYTNTVGGNTQYWATTSYAFDEDLAGSMMAIVGFDIGADGTIDCFNTNQNDAVLVTMLDEITAPFTQSCNATGDAVNITFTISGGMPGFDGSLFTVAGDGAGGTVANGDSYTILNHPPNTPFSITVDDANGCQMMFSGLSIELPSLIVDMTQDASCNGSLDGSISVQATGGMTPYTYTWSHDNMLNAPDANNLDPGNYSVTVIDQNGCTAESTAMIGASVVINPNGVTSDVNCGGTATGSITLTPSGSPNLPFTYTWSPNAATGNSNSANNLIADTYFVTVTDNAGCFETASYIITEPVSLTAMAMIDSDISCNGVNDGIATVSGAGGAGGYTFSWSASANNQTTVTATGLSPGLHTVTVSDLNGCTATSEVTFANPLPLDVMINVLDNVSCNGFSDGSAQAVISGGTPIYTFLWENGETNETAAMLPSGIQNLTVTDSNGCIGTGTVFISEPMALSGLAFLVSDVICGGTATGSASASANGGTMPYAFEWDNGEAAALASALNAGLHIVSITDSEGCLTTADVLVSENPELTATTVIDTDISCNGSTDGVATASVGGGTGIYTYIWDNGTTDATSSNLGPGAHFVTISDSNGCEATSSATITEPPPLDIMSTTVNVSCFGVADGSATLVVNGGSVPYTYDWSNGGTEDNITGLAAGNHDFTITDATGCVQTGSITINEPLELTAMASVDNQVLCSGEATGAASVVGNGGTMPYTYIWNNGGTTATVTNLTVGPYEVTVTDVNNCVAVGSVIINEPSVLAGILTGNQPSCNASTDGSVSAVVVGGSPPYIYLWNDGQTDDTAVNLGSGDYTVTVSDANNCQIVETFQLGEPSAISAAIMPQSPSCVTTCDGQASIITSGGAGNYQYNWDNGEIGPNPIFLCAGLHSVTITDQDGCFIIENFQIDPPAPIIPDVLSTSPASCNGGSDGSATFVPAGGTLPYTFEWTDIVGVMILTETGNASALSGLSAGVYFVEVTDVNGCFLPPISLTVNEPAMPLSLSVTGVDPVCNGGDDGFAFVDPVGGTPSYNYEWNTTAGSQFTQTAFNLEAGEHFVTVTDANGCSATTSVLLSEPDPVFAEVSSEGAICFGDANGSITIDTSFGGMGPYIYSLDGEIFTASNFFGGLSGGLYTTYVQDINGCEFSTDILVEQPAEIIVNAGSDITIDLGDSTQIVTEVNVFDADSLDYLWSPPMGLSCMDCPDPWVRPMSTTTYTVQVTDTLGCVATNEITITVDKSRDVFIPNVFTPNGDGINDNFMIFGGIGVTQIEVLKIYDRWGELLFEASNFQPNDPFFSWNGTLKGKRLNPSVFVYFAEISFFDGVTIPYKGDVTLLK
ncbi:MAG: gliding motility-associated C-terminal domain-containing protein [Bacteroidota bacterium]